MNIIIGTIGLVLLVVLIFIFNRFVHYKNNVKDAWSNIDVFLKKRYELVPGLVNIVKGYASHEEKTFLKVVEARSRAMNLPLSDSSEREKAEIELSGHLSRVLILQEDYPDLKSNTTFLELQNQLIEIESDLEKSRRYYNATVRENNTFVESFPANLFRSLFGFMTYEFFHVHISEREVKQFDL